MSINYYNHLWQECINQLMEQIEEESVPVLEGQDKKKRSDLEWFQYYGTLYIKYIDIYKKLEDCYDQLIHPQKRTLLKEMLVNAMIRMCEIKQKVVKYSTQTNVIQSQFINFDELVMDLKLTPKCLQVPIPRFFREQEQQRIEQRDNMIKQLMKELHDTALPEQEVTVESLFLETNMQTTIRIIQKIERGRQGIARVQEICRLTKLMKDKRKLSLQEQPSEEQIFNKYSTAIQKYWRAFAARRELHDLRQGQLKFLGIQKEIKKDKVEETAELNRQTQKKLQVESEKKYIQDHETVRENIRKAEGYNMKERMLDQRRKWIQGYMAIKGFNQLPYRASDFYKKEDVPADKSQSPKKKKKEEESPDKKKKKKTGKAIVTTEQVGPSQAVMKLEENIRQYDKVWVHKSHQQQHSGGAYNIQMLKDKVRPDVQKTIQQIVDAMIGLELDNMRIKLGIKRKKLKRKKKAKKKKKKTRKVKIPLGLGKKDPRDLLAQLVDLNIVKFLKPAKMADLKGETNCLGSIQERLSDMMPDPSYAQLRQVLTQNIAIPLGSTAAKQRLAKNSWFLLYGPSGTGKTLVVRAIQTQCNCILLDLSPENLENKFTDKKELKRIIWMSIIVAKKYQPAIILIEEVENIFQTKKKKKKDLAPPNPAVKLKTSFVQMKKNKLWQKTDRISVIGCSIRPYNGSTKMIKKMFHKCFYFPYPNYATRKLLFQRFLKQKTDNIPTNFPYSTICQISEGFTAGSFKQTVEKVLTDQRIKRLQNQPLKLSEFVVPLANTYCTYAQQYQKLKGFTDEVTGLKERRQQKQKVASVEAAINATKNRNR